MADYWSETGKMFGSLIEKPKMTEKLLKNHHQNISMILFLIQ